jgi:putative transposase
MSNSWTEVYFHIVFSTKHRHATIATEWEGRLHSFIAGVARDLKATPLEINGMSEHLHLLLRFPADLALVDLVRHVKSRSSKWVHQSIPGGSGFHWQDGYGGFSVSKTAVDNVARCVRDQKIHHATLTFDEEWQRFLRRAGRDER